LKTGCRRSKYSADAQVDPLFGLVARGRDSAQSLKFDDDGDVRFDIRRAPLPGLEMRIKVGGLMTSRGLEQFYEPNLRLTRAHGLIGYNAGYAVSRDGGDFDQHQKDLVWRLLGDAPIGRDSIVVDVGCGVGGPSTWIFERYSPAHVVGVDYCRPSVRAATSRWAGRAHRPRFLCGDAQTLPFSDGSVDFIFNLESALHYADKPRFLAECHRVLKPGGRLCLGDITTKHRKLFAASRLLNLVNTQFSTHARLWSTSDYLKAFETAGFALQRHEQVSREASNSLFNGLRTVGRVGWRAAKGYRGRFFYLWLMERLLRGEWLIYDLFSLAKPATVDRRLQTGDYADANS
jgi:ubiquinone/menaquinone biosynthesis C-methylase UbiE